MLEGAGGGMTSPARILDLLISERQFQDMVIELALRCGWLVHAERPGLTSKGYRTPIQGIVGYPDLTMCHVKMGRVVWAELKSEKGKVTAMQKAWLDALKLKEKEVYIWRPSMWEQIVSTLRGRQ